MFEFFDNEILYYISYILLCLVCLVFFMYKVSTIHKRVTKFWLKYLLKNEKIPILKDIKTFNDFDQKKRKIAFLYFFIYFFLFLAIFKLWSLLIDYAFEDTFQEQTRMNMVQEKMFNEYFLQNLQNKNTENNENTDNKEHKEHILYWNDTTTNISFSFNVKELIDLWLLYSNDTRRINNNINNKINENTSWSLLDTLLFSTQDYQNSLYLHQNKIKTLDEFIYYFKRWSYSIDPLWLLKNLLEWKIQIWLWPLYLYASESKTNLETYNWTSLLDNTMNIIFWWKIIDVYNFYKYKWENIAWWKSSDFFNTAYAIVWMCFMILLIVTIFKQILWWGWTWWFLNRKLEKDEIVSNEDLWNVIKMWWNEDLNDLVNEIVKLNSVSWWSRTKWILLYWPPGTWKTLFWKQVATKLWVPFKYVSTGIFQDWLVWWTQKRIKNFFAEVRKEIEKSEEKQYIIFLDELDSLWAKRSSESWNYTSVKHDWLNQLLTELDWFKNNDWIILIWATNMMQSLDEALLSRFDYKIIVNLPNKEARKEILKNHLQFIYDHQTHNWCVNLTTLKYKKFWRWYWLSKFKWYKQSSTTNTNKKYAMFEKKSIMIFLKVLSQKFINNEELFDKYSLLLEWFSGRDIKKVVDILVNKAIIEESEVNENMLWRAIEEFIIWKDKKNQFNKDQLKIIAYHEMWHAIIWKKLWKIIAQISIAAKSMSLGQTFLVNWEDKILPYQKDILNDIYWLLWWRAAEKIYLWSITAWSQNDYERVTKMLISYLLLNFDYTVKHKKEVMKRLWISHIESVYKLWYVVSNFYELSQKEQSKVFEMIKIIICDCEIETENLLLEEDKTMKHYVDLLIDTLVIYWEDFNLIH